MRTRKVKKIIPPGLHTEVLRAAHDAVYVCNASLSAIFQVKPVISWRVLKALEEGDYIRLVGEPIECSYLGLRGKRFYTPTGVDLTDAFEVPTKIETCKQHRRNHDPEDTLPGAYLVVRRFVKGEADPSLGAKVKGVKKKRNRHQESQEERIPLRRAGANAAVGFFASVVNAVTPRPDTCFEPEMMLRREKNRIDPMPDGLFLINKIAGDALGRYEYSYRIEFESYKKTKKRYLELFDLLERCVSPTIYIVASAKMAVFLDGLASGRKHIAVVMLGDTLGCESAVDGLLQDCYWQAPARYESGKLAGYDVTMAEADENEEVPPPGLRHLSPAAIEQRKAGFSVPVNA